MLVGGSDNCLSLQVATVRVQHIGTCAYCTGGNRTAGCWVMSDIMFVVMLALVTSTSVETLFVCFSYVIIQLFDWPVCLEVRDLDC